VVFGMYWAWVLLVIFPFSFLNFVCIERPGIRLGNILRQRTVQAETQASLPTIHLNAPSEPAATESALK
jgi:peptidoglycan/LPS O-acetylase OafA/YrhL